MIVPPEDQSTLCCAICCILDLTPFIAGVSGLALSSSSLKHCLLPGEAKCIGNVSHLKKKLHIYIYVHYFVYLFIFHIKTVQSCKT